MRVLITGAEGFVGGHLIRELTGRGHIVLGTYLETPNSALDISWIQCNLARRESVEAALRNGIPDAVIHLAAVSHVPEAEAQSESAFVTNVIGVDNLLGVLESQRNGVRVLTVSSGEIYGQTQEVEQPIAERERVAPRNIYGVTKACSEIVSFYYARERNMNITVVRPFNQIGPGQADRFVCASFSRQIARVMLRMTEPRIRVGNLQVERDFTDVRDMCRAYALAVEGNIGPGPFNIASGRSVSIREILDMLIELSGISMEVTVDESRVRRTDIKRMVGDSGIFRKSTSWKPEISLRQSLSDTLSYWLDIERMGSAGS